MQIVNVEVLKHISEMIYERDGYAKGTDTWVALNRKIDSMLEIAIGNYMVVDDEAIYDKGITDVGECSICGCRLGLMATGVCKDCASNIAEEYNKYY